MNYNTSDVKSYFSGLTSSQWRTFASDCSSNWVNAWTSRFTVSSRFQTSLGSVTLFYKNAFINGANNIADEIDSGKTIDCSGLVISDGDGNSIKGIFVVHVDVTMNWVPTASFWIEHRNGN
jgi:hypothetical protein